MNHHPPAYTPLEAFALFQELNRNFQNGLVIGTFSRISDTLKHTPIIYEQDGYDAGRLSPDSLQNFALQILREEKRLDGEAAAADKNIASLSPNSRKRKFQSPPLPTFQEALEQKDKLPNLVEKLYNRFRDDMIRLIREDERRYDDIQREISEIERGEWDDRLRLEKQAELRKNGVSNAGDGIPAKPEAPVVPAPIPASVRTPTPVPTPTPTPTRVQAPTPIPVPPKVPEPVKKIEPSHVPHPSQEKKAVQPIPPPQPPTPTPRTSIEARHVTPDTRSQEPVRPITSAVPVLQHPQAVQPYPARPGSAPPPPPVTDGLQRPEGIPKGRSPAPVQSNQSHNPAPVPALKWEPPYQPPHPSPHPHIPHQPSPQPSHPAHQPTPPPPPQLQPQPQHQPPHQTPVPSPRPPYGAGVTRPPTYPSHSPPGHPQFPQNYVGGRQTPGQYAQPPRPPVQGAAPASPSVLLPPQNAGQIPPSLQSLPLNATPDGAGQQAQPQRSTPLPATSSPGPIVGPRPYVQHPGQHVPTAQTPVRPPAALSTTHSTAGSVKPPVPPAQWTQPPVPPRAPQTPVQPPPAPPQSQPQAVSRSYNSPYWNHQAQEAQPAKAAAGQTHRPQVPQLQTPANAPQATRSLPVSQVHTPVAASPHIIRGLATKWVATPTPATPRTESMTGYFDVESPSFEPLSPPPQAAQLPKTSPVHSGKKDMRKSITKFDGSVSRPRGRPRLSQKPAPPVPSEEPAAEPDLAGSTIKNEEATPRGLEEIGDTAAADESAPSQVQTGPTQPSNKRKRQDSPPNRAPPTPATHVLWTRSFNKISQSALDQIISHRHANMFAHPVKPKTAPGYFEIVLRPQDLKGIQKAITAGSKAAAAAVATMTDVESNATNIWIPISVDLVPPRGIINIAQLERELVHMFANAIMYNPDPYRGFGPSLLRANRRAAGDDDGEDYRGYEVDENGVVKDTRSMFGEVEKLLGDLRNEVERNAPPLAGVLPTSVSRSVSAAVGGGDRDAGNAGGAAAGADDDVDELAGPAVTPSEGSKRRRVRG